MSDIGGAEFAAHKAGAMKGLNVPDSAPAASPTPVRPPREGLGSRLRRVRHGIASVFELETRERKMEDINRSTLLEYLNRHVTYQGISGRPPDEVTDRELYADYALMIGTVDTDKGRAIDELARSLADEGVFVDRKYNDHGEIAWKADGPKLAEALRVEKLKTQGASSEPSRKP